jgi:hypothetical protein
MIINPPFSVDDDCSFLDYRGQRHRLASWSAGTVVPYRTAAYGKSHNRQGGARGNAIWWGACSPGPGLDSRAGSAGGGSSLERLGFGGSWSPWLLKRFAPRHREQGTAGSVTFTEFWEEHRSPAGQVQVAKSTRRASRSHLDAAVAVPKYFLRGNYLLLSDIMLNHSFYLKYL